MKAKQIFNALTLLSKYIDLNVVDMDTSETHMWFDFPPVDLLLHSKISDNLSDVFGDRMVSWSGQNRKIRVSIAFRL